MVNSLRSIELDAANPLQAYENFYFAYYTEVSNFLNPSIQKQF